MKGANQLPTSRPNPAKPEPRLADAQVARLWLLLHWLLAEAWPGGGPFFPEVAKTLEDAPKLLGCPPFFWGGVLNSAIRIVRETEAILKILLESHGLRGFVHNHFTRKMLKVVNSFPFKTKGNTMKQRFSAESLERHTETFGVPPSPPFLGWSSKNDSQKRTREAARSLAARPRRPGPAPGRPRRCLGRCSSRPRRPAGGRATWTWAEAAGFCGVGFFFFFFWGGGVLTDVSFTVDLHLAGGFPFSKKSCKNPLTPM